MTTLNTALTDRTSIAELAEWLSSPESPDAAAQDVLDAAVDMLLGAAPPGTGAATLSQMASLRRAPAAALERADASGGADDRGRHGFLRTAFAGLAADRAEFDAFMREVYGDDYEKALAEQYRQQALAGDFCGCRR